MQTITVVGNGHIDSKLASAIDASDIVVRFNEFRSFGTGGVRTDIIAVCNTGRPAASILNSPEWQDHPAVRQATAVWCVRDPAKFSDMRPSLSISHPELDDFCDDYTAKFLALCKSTGKTCVVIPGAIHEATDEALAFFSLSPYIVPSSGMIVIEQVLRAFFPAQISIVGFSHEGWEGHPFEAEKLLIESYISKGLLKRL